MSSGADGPKKAGPQGEKRKSPEDAKETEERAEQPAEETTPQETNTPDTPGSQKEIKGQNQREAVRDTVDEASPTSP